MSNASFHGKAAIVTGGANGIGRCIAKRLSSLGVQVHVIDTDKEAGEKSGLSFFHGDIADKGTLDRFIGALAGSVDIIINNACVSRRGLLSGCSYEDFEYVLRIGVTAPYYITSALLEKGMLSQGASIINIASTRAFQSQEDTESYSAAKGGIAALTHAMSVSLAGRARVNSISPGWIDTSRYHESGKVCEWSSQDKSQHPVMRIGEPEDIASMALFLCSEEAGFITGQDFVVDGGMSKLMVYHGDHGWSYDTEKDK
ncbi:MAG: SDR family oxidoreductase [Clostridiales bacterium]|jgi:NAD(P)-dependent dehydrogenase (short-subunit alcohol dehydrogenase family)|nr:SDR family oxidoreductase [Clostridiales bacterium]